MMTSRALFVFASAIPLGLMAQPTDSRERCLLYVVERISPEDAPAVDGKLTEGVWRKRERIETLRNFLGSQVGDFASQRSEFIVLCDGVNLFIGATFHEAEMKKIKASPANAPFWNDCIEVYFDPRHDGTRSIQLVIDCIGQRMWQKQCDEGYGWHADAAWYMLADWEGKSARGQASWTVEIRVNCASFGIDPTPGSVCGFNPCRFRLGASDEFSAWAFAGRRRQKSIPDWGHLLFAAPGDRVRGREVTLADIQRIYPDAEHRQIEVPVPDGFRVFTEAGTRRVTFADQLAPALARCEKLAAVAGDAAKSAAERLGAKHAFLAELQRTLTETQGLLSRIRSTKLTIGACDRSADALRKASQRLDHATWQVRVAMLVSAVQRGGKPL